MFHILLNGSVTLDAENNQISYASREDALCALSYFDLSDDDVGLVFSWRELLEYQTAQREARNELG